MDLITENGLCQAIDHCLPYEEDYYYSSEETRSLADDEPEVLLNDEDSTPPVDEATEWLKQCYSKASTSDAILVQFQAGKDLYFLPRHILVDNFAYFKAALRSHGNYGMFREGQTGHVHLSAISAPAFALLLRWIILNRSPKSNTCVTFCTLNPLYRGYTSVTQVLEAFIAADYLGISSGDVFEEYLTTVVSLILLDNRRALATSHITLVQNHPLFLRQGRSTFYDIFAKAAVRPCLQQHKVNYTGHHVWDNGEWEATVQHYRGLRDENDGFSAVTLNQISEFLARARMLSDERNGMGSHMVLDDPLLPWCPALGTGRCFCLGIWGVEHRFSL